MKDDIQSDGATVRSAERNRHSAEALSFSRPRVCARPAVYRVLLGFWLALAAVVVQPVAAAEEVNEQISEIVVFGASLSDVGNVALATANLEVPFVQPPYFMGRFADGPLWHEVMAEELGLAPAALPSLVGGNNFAWGGAEAGPGLSAFGVPNIGTQIAEFLGREAELGRLPLAGDELVILASAGANNLLPPGPVQEPDAIIEALETHIVALAAAGARRFLVTNIFDFETAPYIEPGLLDPGLFPPGVPTQEDAENILSRASEVNRRLRFRLFRLERRLDREYDDVTLIHFDKFLVSRLVSRAAPIFGIDNTTDTALTPPFIGCLCTGIIEEGVEPDAYFWFDSIHPTGRVHEILGYVAARVVKQRLRYGL